jgi:predicted metal-dependent hydrolase
MMAVIELGDLKIAVTRKAVKNVHLSVHPPIGRVTLVAPVGTRLEVVRAFAISKLGWIRDQQSQLLSQARESPRKYVERESHYVWGRRYLLTVQEVDAKPFVKIDHRRIFLTIRPGATVARRDEVIHEWLRSQMHTVLPELIRKWERKLGVTVAAYFLQKMKTKWGGCNHHAKTIRLNTELAKKPRDLLEYVVVHEMLHLVEPSHSERFLALLDKHYPAWREARMELNELPLGAERWSHG